MPKAKQQIPLITPQSAFTALAANPDIALSGGLVDGPPITLRELPPLAIYLIKAWPGRAQIVAEILGNQWLPDGNGPTSRALLQAGHDEWMAVSAATDPLPTSLISADDASLVEVSHGWAGLQIIGDSTHLADILQHGSSIDFEGGFTGQPTSFRAKLGPFSAQFHWHKPDCCDILVSRSLAIAFWEWICAASGDYRWHWEAHQETAQE